MTPLARSISSKKALVTSGDADDDGEGGETVGLGGRVKLTKKERKKVEDMIRKAKTLVEIERLEKELNEGRVPGARFGQKDSDDDMED
jgi:U2 small nuclear ribonucleoprotein A'